MGKKVLPVLAIIIGTVLTAGFLVGLLDFVAILLSSENASFKIGYFLGKIIFLIIGISLIVYGYKKLNPKKNKRKETIEDIGRSE